MTQVKNCKSRVKGRCKVSGARCSFLPNFALDVCTDAGAAKAKPKPKKPRKKSKKR